MEGTSCKSVRRVMKRRELEAPYIAAAREVIAAARAKEGVHSSRVAGCGADSSSSDSDDLDYIGN